MASTHRRCTSTSSMLRRPLARGAQKCLKERTARERLTRSSPDQSCKLAQTLTEFACWVPSTDSGRARRAPQRVPSIAIVKLDQKVHTFTHWRWLPVFLGQLLLERQQVKGVNKSKSSTQTLNTDFFSDSRFACPAPVVAVWGVWGRGGGGGGGYV